LDESYVFKRTPRGETALQQKDPSLGVTQRRCMLLANGKRTVRDIAACFRPGELGPILKELVDRGLLQPPPSGTAPIVRTAEKIAFIDDQRFAEIQQRAMKEINEKLGPAGKAVATQISACARPEQLRITLRIVEKALQAAVGADYAKDFVKRVGQELMGG